MALIGRLFVIFFAFLFACLVAGMIVVGAVLYPEFSDLGTREIDQSAFNVVLGSMVLAGIPKMLCQQEMVEAKIGQIISMKAHNIDVLRYSVWPRR